MRKYQCMMMSLKTTSAALFVAAGLIVTGAAFTSPAHAMKENFYTGHLDNLAVEGHDPVAYFKEGKPVKGSSDFSMTYKGAEFRFASAENLATFKADPDAYAPQYGGYCAWAVSQGYTAKGDANYWKIVDGKLYLNYNKGVQQTWETNIPGFIQSANTNWPKVIQ